MTQVELDPRTGGLALSDGQNSIVLHPLWVRERVSGDGLTDPISHQRLYEHADLPEDLRITDIPDTARRFREDATLELIFSDGQRHALHLDRTLQEIGWRAATDSPPEARAWTSNLYPLPQFEWSTLDNPDALLTALDSYFIHGFCIFQNTPTDRDVLLQLARRFGYLRETNFGELFNVEMKPSASDLAYTDVALASHTDNPYRDPVPGIQFLHCLTNEVLGGYSTLVDGMALAQALRDESPEQADILERVSVRFRYEGPSGILEHHGPLIERDKDGVVHHVRLSSRLDYVPALDPETLNIFYAGRRRLHEMSNSGAFQVSFPFRPGTLLMMDNYRLLHGRTAFDGKQGHRHLQGCYIDHDGPASLYRMLRRGDTVTAVRREI